MERYQEVTKQMVLARAGLADWSEKSLAGAGFYLRLTFGGNWEETVVRIMAENFDNRAGLWFMINKPTILGQPVRGVQYVVRGIPLGPDAEEEGWYIGLGNDPHGEFVKLEKFRLLDDAEID